MPEESASATGTLRGNIQLVNPAGEILALWAAVLDDHQIVQGRNSTHWRVVGPAGHLALRLYGHDVTEADAHAEQDLLDALHASGVLVPVPVLTLDGRRVVSTVDGLWAAFTWVEGSPLARSDAVAATAAGRALARAHAVAPAVKPAKGWGFLTAYWATPRWDGRSLLDAVVTYRGHDRERCVRLEQVHGDLVEILRPLADLRRDLVTVHYDFHPENLLLTSSGIAILDWAFAHADHHTTDLAIALRSWPERFHDVVDGYEQVRGPLTPRQRAAIPALAAARGMDHLSDRLTRWAAGMWPDPSEEVDRELDDIEGRLLHLAD